MKRLILVSAFALLAAGRGQYVGAHAPATLPTQAVVGSGPGGDIPDTVGPGAVRGDARTLQAHPATRGKGHPATHHGGGRGSRRKSLSRIGRTFRNGTSACCRPGSPS